MFLRLLRDGGFRLPSLTLPVGYSERALPLIRKFCPADQSGDDEFRGPDGADMPPGNSESGTNGEARHADGSICATRKGPEEQGPKKLHETKPNAPVPRTPQGAHNRRNKLRDKALQSPLLQLVLHTPTSDLRVALDKWIEDGNCLVTEDLLQVYSHLRMLPGHRKTFRFLDWIKTGELLNFEERDYAYHLQLVARYRSIEAAQKYIERVPKYFRNLVLYETLLAIYVRMADVQKAEEVFQEIINLSFPLTVTACNQMLLLYKNKKVDRTKVASILMLMEKENIKPSSFTYKILVYMNLRSNDTSGMDGVLDIMKANVFEPDVVTQKMIAKFYISRGLTEKAEEVIKAMEVYVNDKQSAIRSLLDLYATLGRPDDVARIWKLCTEPKLWDYLAAIEAWGKLGNIEQAEQAFGTLLKASPKLTSKYLYAMINVYAGNKLLSKGEELLERLLSARCPRNELLSEGDELLERLLSARCSSDPLTCRAVFNLYVNSVEVKKADSFLLKLVAQKKLNRISLFSLHIKLLKAYAENGDIYNTEKIFARMKKMRYSRKRLLYDVLLEAYVNAKFPAYGFRERMRADKVLPSTNVNKQLNDIEKYFLMNETEAPPYCLLEAYVKTFREDESRENASM